jgi:hypothetical protein
MESAQDSVARKIRTKIYSCGTCDFVREVVGIENLTQREEALFIVHLRKQHGLEP